MRKDTVKQSLGMKVTPDAPNSDPSAPVALRFKATFVSAFIS